VWLVQVIPWLSASDQALVFPNGLRFDTKEAQEAHIREWLAGRVRCVWCVCVCVSDGERNEQPSGCPSPSDGGRSPPPTCVYGGTPCGGNP